MFQSVCNFPAEIANHSQALRWIQLLFVDFTGGFFQERGKALCSSTDFLPVKSYLLCRQKLGPSYEVGGVYSTGSDLGYSAAYH